jgi:cell wall-associated NlpC family hydrolase
MLNIPYKFGGNSILGIDCSAYVKKVYGFLGMDLPRTAREQFNEGETIDKEELSIGDLVFFRTYASFPSHVGIYMGNNLFIHASPKGKKVKVDNLDTPYFVKRFIGAKRLLTDENKSADPQD